MSEFLNAKSKGKCCRPLQLSQLPLDVLTANKSAGRPASSQQPINQVFCWCTVSNTHTHTRLPQLHKDISSLRTGGECSTGIYLAKFTLQGAKESQVNNMSLLLCMVIFYFFFFFCKKYVMLLHICMKLLWQ